MKLVAESRPEREIVRYDREGYEVLRAYVIKYEPECRKRKIKRQEHAQEYNLHYITVPTKRPYFIHLKQYCHHHRTNSDGNHSKLYLEIVGRSDYPTNTK